MWEIQIAGEDLYHILNWFFIYSFLGWVWESCYVSVKQKKLVNRGFVAGPVCTIYGLGAVSVYLLLKPISANLVVLYLGGVIVPTILEYVTAVLMETIFHTSWWDYSRKRFNFQGRICLGASLGWGAFTVILFYVFQPAVDRIVALYSYATGKLLVSMVSLLYAVDFGMSFMNAMQVGEKLQNMDTVMEEFYEYMQSTKLFRTKEELRERIASYIPPDYERPELKKRLEARIDAMVAFTTEVTAEEQRRRKDELRAQIEERIAGIQSRYTQLRSHGNPLNRRLMNAYPHMKSRAQVLRDRRKSNH
jgi:uncharacterized membrane protein